MKLLLAITTALFLTACGHMGHKSCACCDKDKAAATAGEGEGCKSGGCKKP